MRITNISSPSEAYHRASSKIYSAFGGKKDLVERSRARTDAVYLRGHGVNNYLRDTSGMTREQVNAALRLSDSESYNTQKWLASVRQRDQQLATLERQQEYEAMMNEYMAGMQEYLGAMSEAMTREEPAAEPLKAAQQEMSAAREDTARRQAVRRGLMSTYTRYGSFGGTQRLGA